MNIRQGQICVVLIHLLLILSNHGFSQEKQSIPSGGGSDADFERIVYYQIEEMASFYEINQFDAIHKDTLFFSHPGFKIYPSWQEVKIGCDIYVIFTYLPFTDGKIGTKREKPALDKADTKVRHPISWFNVKWLCMPKKDFDQLKKKAYYSTRFKTLANYKITSGLLTLPLKIRGRQDNYPFQLSTDVTLGPYLGITKRLSPYSRTYVTIPVSFGVTVVNINSNTTSVTATPDPKAGLTPGISWATGLTLQWMEQRTTVGIFIGKDYASDFGDGWRYHNKLWYSFGIGYSFYKKN
jgi:hypothetical protein